jgi:hypothetical protein
LADRTAGLAQQFRSISAADAGPLHFGYPGMGYAAEVRRVLGKHKRQHAANGQDNE